MIDCEKLTGVIARLLYDQRDANNCTVALTNAEAVEVYNGLMALDRIQKIAESDHGGAEYWK